MAMDYKKAIQTVAARRAAELAAAGRLFDEAMEVNPELYETEKKLRAAKLNALTDICANAQVTALEAEKTRILTHMGISADMLAPPPHCSKCGDSGLSDGRICDCARTLAVKSAGNTVELPVHSFDDIDYSMIEESAREDFTQQARRLVGFCEKFPHTNFKNLVLLGGTGTGKTYLAGCVAGEVLKKGAAVVFITAFEFVNRMLKYHTTFDDQKLSYLSPVLDCDLLIIDDLGTESIFKNVTLEYFYLVLNDRMLKSRHTLVTSNLSRTQLESRYGERIASRLFDKKLCFVRTLSGGDIRKI